MKTLHQHITEKLKVNKDYEDATYKPKKYTELMAIILDECKEQCEQPNFNGNLDLTGIDVSGLDTLSQCFKISGMEYYVWKIQTVDVTGWDVSNVHFFDQTFAGLERVHYILGLSDWDVSV